MRTTLCIGAAALVLVTGMACGGGDGNGSGSTGSTSGSSSTDASGTKKVTVTGTEALKFDPASFTATKGDKISLDFTISGAIPHNFKLEKFGVKDSDTLVSKAGDKKTSEFTADETGSFDYVCTIHPSMKGTLTVA
jgi:plastocyanin